MGWIQDHHNRQRDYILKQDIKKGDFVQPDNCFEGVYWEVAEVWGTLAKVYVPDNQKTGKVKTELVALYRFSKVFKTLPDNAYSVCTSKGHYSEQLGTIRQVNPSYRLLRGTLPQTEGLPLFNQPAQ